MKRTPGLLILLVLLLSTQAGAERKLVDRVVAVVEDEPIFLSNLEDAVKQYFLETGERKITLEKKRIAEKQILKDLIANKLILAQAKRLGINVSYSDIDQNVENTIEEYKKRLGGEEGFNRQLSIEGLTLEELRDLYREQIRERMIVERVISSEIDRSKIIVSEKELRESYEKRKADLPKRPEVVRLATILFSFKTSFAAKQEAKDKIDKIYEKVVSGMDFSKAAQTYSEDPSGELGGDLGFLKLEDIQDKSFIATAETLSVGEISRPAITRFGYHIIKMVEKNPENDEVHLMHILVRVKPAEEDIREIYERAQKVHDELMKGAPFDSLATVYSEDAATASKGGDLGWLRVQDLPEFFRDILKDMKVGDISPVLRESSGFRIVKLLGREEEREYSYEEIKEELRDLIRQEKMNQAIENYVENLRKKIYVDVRY